MAISKHASKTFDSLQPAKMHVTQVRTLLERTAQEKQQKRIATGAKQQCGRCTSVQHVRIHNSRYIMLKKHLQQSGAPVANPQGDACLEPNPTTETRIRASQLRKRQNALRWMKQWGRIRRIRASEGSQAASFRQKNVLSTNEVGSSTRASKRTAPLLPDTLTRTRQHEAKDLASHRCHLLKVTPGVLIIMRICSDT